MTIHEIVAYVVIGVTALVGVIGGLGLSAWLHYDREIAETMQRWKGRHHDG